MDCRSASGSSAFDQMLNTVWGGGGGGGELMVNLVPGHKEQGHVEIRVVAITCSIWLAEATIEHVFQ